MTLAGPALLLGSTAAATAVTATAATVAFDRAARRNADLPERGDRTANRSTAALAGIGIAGFVGAGILTTRQPAAFPLIGVGFGTAAGALIARGAYTFRHGATPESLANDVLRSYDHNRNGQIDLDTRRFQRNETLRSTTSCSEDSRGRETCTTRIYSIDRLVRQANTNGDNAVTREELVGFIRSFSSSPDGRLSRHDMRTLDSVAGEQLVSRSRRGW